MLRFVLDAQGQVDRLGVLQAWDGVYAAYKERPEVTSATLDSIEGEGIVFTAKKGVGAYDGGLIVARSGNDAHIYIGPGSGKEDYASWAIIGVHAVASAKSNAWVNTLWSSYLTDIYDPIMATVRPFLTRASRVQTTGFSLGGGMGHLFARALALENLIDAPVDAVGFGMPRAIATPFPAMPVRAVRFVNQLDPVDLVPPEGLITLDGGPLPNLPAPNAWANLGTRYAFSTFGNLTQQDDLPWPGSAAFLLLLPNFIVNHTSGQYARVVQAYYTAGLANGNFGVEGNSFLNALTTLQNDIPINVPVVFPPIGPQKQPPHVAPLLPPAPAVQGGGPDYILPFVWPPVSTPSRASVPAGIGHDPQ